MRHPFCVLPVYLVFVLPAGAQQMDVEAMMRWSSAELVYYTVEGVYSGAAPITATMGGYADVVDRVSLTFEWRLTEAVLVNVTSLNNYVSEIANLRDYEATCLPPVLNGAYEHATVLEVTNGLGGALDLKIERSYPTVDVAQSCTASRKSVPAGTTMDMVSMAVPSPVMLAMGVPATDALSVTADKKSMIVKHGDWTWTFTPDTSPPGN